MNDCHLNVSPVTILILTLFLKTKTKGSFGNTEFENNRLKGLILSVVGTGTKCPLDMSTIQIQTRILRENSVRDLYIIQIRDQSYIPRTLILYLEKYNPGPGE